MGERGAGLSWGHARQSLAGDNYYVESDLLQYLGAFDKNRWKFSLILHKSKHFAPEKRKKIRLRRKTNEKDYPDFTDFSERSGIRIRGNRGGSDRNRQINSRRREESDKPEGGEKKDGKTLW